MPAATGAAPGSAFAPGSGISYPSGTVPATGTREPRLSPKNPSGACARTFGWRTMSGKSSIGEPLLRCPRKPRKATIAIPSRRKTRKKPRSISVLVHHGDVLAATLFQEPLRFAFSKARIARFDDQKKSVVRRAAKTVPVENRMVPARQSVHDQHGEERGESREKDRQLEHYREECGHCLPIDRFPV